MSVRKVFFGTLGLVILINLILSMTRLDRFYSTPDGLILYLAAESEQRPVFILTFAL